MTDPKLLDRLRKLKAIATSADQVGNEAEAQAFANMIQTLLAKHKLDASEVEWETQRRETFVKVKVTEAYPSRRRKQENHDLRRRRPDWETILVMAVARFSSVRALTWDGTAIFAFYGPQLDAEGAKEAFLYLRQAAETLSVQEARLALKPDTSNLIGYVEGQRAADCVKLQDEVEAQLASS